MKSIFNSKTFWTNIISIIAIIVQSMTGKMIIDAEAQVAILGVVNVILRMVTKEPVTWK